MEKNSEKYPARKYFRLNNNDTVTLIDKEGFANYVAERMRKEILSYPDNITMSIKDQFLISFTLTP